VPESHTRDPRSTWIRSLPWNFTVDVLSPDDLTKLHDNSLAILDKVGIAVKWAPAIDALADAGARVDRDANRVFFPPGLIEKQLALAPSSFLLAARDSALDLHIGGGHGYLATDGCVADIVDIDTGTRRRSTKQDLADVTRLADALPQIGFHWQPVSAGDTPNDTRPLHEVQAQFLNTAKHIQQMTVIDGENARGALEMARIVAGGAEELRRRPLMSNFQCSISPLAWEDGPLEAMVVFAEAGLPVGACSMPLSCATAPATVAGLLTIANAEILSGIAILETMHPGAPTFYVSYATSMDLNSGTLNLGWGPEELFAEMVCTQMARRYGIPSTVGTFGTGSKLPDWQAGVQNALSGFAKVFAPGDMLTAAGSLYGDRAYSFEALVLDAEIFDLLCHFADGYSFDEDHLAFGPISKVGPGGHFLANPHTLANMRESWMSGLFERRTWEDWEEEGRPSPVDGARERAREILGSHEPLPLPDGMEDELAKVIEAQERG